jgi:hypothetical protein
MTTGLDVSLTKADGTETFKLRTEKVTSKVSNGLVSRSILSGLGDLVAGSDPVLNTETYKLQNVRIRNVDASDYPNSSSYSNDNYGMENELRRAAKEYGPSLAQGFDTLNWDGRQIDVVITDFTSEQSQVEDGVPRVYTANIEVTHVDVYVG